MKQAVIGLGLSALLGALVAAPHGAFAQSEQTFSLDGTSPPPMPVDAGLNIGEPDVPPPVTARDFGEQPRMQSAEQVPHFDLPPVQPSELGPPLRPAVPATATAPAPAPQAPVAAAPDANEQAIAQAIASLLTPAPGARPNSLDPALATAYAERSYAPLWVAQGHVSPKGLAAIARIRAAGQDGLDPEIFLLPDPASTAHATPEDLAKLDLALTRASLVYARQAQAGRVNPRSLSPLLTANPPVPDPVEAFRTLAGASDVAAALDGFNPPHPGFQALRAKLMEIAGRQHTTRALPVVPPGPTLKPGMVDGRMPALRERLGLPGSYSDAYEPDVVAAVQAFQKSAGLNADGALGALTVKAMNAHESKDPVADILANMERWRWLPRDLGATHVLVNIPEFQLRIFRDGQESYRTRVIVGKPQNQTPVFSDRIQYVNVNPSWNVPSSIANKEMLPNLRNDPSFLARQGIEVLYVNGNKAQVVNPYAIDWATTNMRNIRFRQPPGERNALGRIKFMFPNEHAVYLHDTPSRTLFARDARALSHGCVRVDQPLEFGEALMHQEGWTEQRLGGLIGGRERTVRFKQPIPVHLAYFTEFVDETGALRSRPDIYGHDRKVKRALGLEGIATAAN